MERISPIHFFPTSDVSIIPNANDSANDLAVSVDRDTKIKVYCPRAGLDTENGEYQEWSLAGRNRRLTPPKDNQGENLNVPYTIYARLNKEDKTNGYIVFAPKNGNASDGWTDKYNYVSNDTVSGLSNVVQAVTDAENWYIRLGDVSLSENGERSVTLDAGILGTDHFNTEWALDPDALPLRIELSCVIAGAGTFRNGGPTPYVYWGESLTLSAALTEGWTGKDIQRFDHWEITRDSGNAQDDAWSSAASSYTSLRMGGQITLQHGRGQGSDDFAGVVSATFTLRAMENTGTQESPVYAVLKSASIDIMAETWETYGLSLSSAMMSYNPQTQSYSPTGGVSIKIRATDQKSETFLLTNEQVKESGLFVEYAVVDASPETWVPVTFPGASSAVAVGNIPTNAFNQAGLNVRLRNSANTELFRTTIACLRDGEDSKEREWIYRLDSNTGYRGTAGTIGGNPSKPVSGQTSGVDNCLLVDDFVPTDWTDEPTGVSSSHAIEYTSYRDYDHDNNRWGAFTTPTIWSHYGEDGDDGLYYIDDYRRYDSRSANATTGAPTGNTDMQDWTEAAPAPTETYKYIWKRSRQYNPNTQAYGTATYVCLTGESGVDAKDVEWAYIRTKTNTAPVILSDNTYTDHNGNTYAADDHLPHVTGNSNVENNQNTYECTDDPKGVDDTWKFEWEIKREKAAADSNGKRAWNYYQGTMTLHANLAESAYIIDLSNDNDQFGTDSNSFVQAQQTRSTTVSVYDGATKQTLSGLNVELVYEDGTPVPGHDIANYSANVITGVVSVILEQNTTTAFSHTEVRALITASVTGKADKQAVFTVRKVMSGQPGLSPTIYQLNPTSKGFVFNRGADGQTLTPATRSTTVNALKTFENVTSDATLADNLTFTWGFDESATSQGSGTIGDSSSNVISVSRALAAAHHQVWIQLSTGDRETLPVVKDGENGANGKDAQYIYLRGTARDEQTSETTTIPCEVNVTGGNNLAIGPSVRGLHFVSLKKDTLDMVERANYDTYGEATGSQQAHNQGITLLRAKLNDIKNGVSPYDSNDVFVCLASFDAIGWSSELISALQEFGMSDLPYTETGRYPFLFIGYKNLGKGNGLTRMRGIGHYYDVVELSAYIANGALTMKDGEPGAPGEDGGPGPQGPRGIAGGPSKVYRGLTYGCTYFSASDGAAETAGELNSQDYIAVRAQEADDPGSGWLIYRCMESFIADSTAVADLNDIISDYENGGDTTKSALDAEMARSSLTPQPSGIPVGKGAFAEVTSNQTAAFFTQLVAKNANIEMLTGAQYYIIDENNVIAGGFGKVEDEGDGKTYMLWAGGATPSASPFSVDNGGNVRMETGVFGGFLKNTARVITAENVEEYVSWGETEDWYLDSNTNRYRRRKAWILDLDKAGSNVIFFSGTAGSYDETDKNYGSIRLELDRLRDEGGVTWTDGVDYHNEIYIPLPWYANRVDKSIGGESGALDWYQYATERMGLYPNQAYARPNVALQYIDSHYRVVNATSDSYDNDYNNPIENGVFRVHFAGLKDMNDMGPGNSKGLLPFTSALNNSQSEFVLECEAGNRSIESSSGTAYGVWWKTTMRNGGPASTYPHLFSAAWMYVYGLIDL